MKKRITVILAVFLIVSLAACGRSETSSTENKADSNEVEELQPETENTQEDTEMKMKVEIGGSTFTATLEDNEAAASLAKMMEEEPVVIEMEDYSGFEKVGSLGTMLMYGKVSQENYVELTAASAIPNKEIKSPQILRY